MPPTNAVLCWMICGSTAVRRRINNLRGKRGRTPQTSENQRLAKFSSTHTIAIRHTSTAGHFPSPCTHFVAKMTEPWRATKSHSRGIPGPLEAIPVCAPGADRGSAWLPRKCSMRNSNGFNPTKIRVPLESTISESHNPNGCQYWPPLLYRAPDLPHFPRISYTSLPILVWNGC